MSQKWQIGKNRAADSADRFPKSREIAPLNAGEPGRYVENLNIRVASSVAVFHGGKNLTDMTVNMLFPARLKTLAGSSWLDRGALWEMQEGQMQFSADDNVMWAVLNCLINDETTQECNIAKKEAHNIHAADRRPKYLNL